ncbi:MAG: bifunctional 3-(3-hydroxy-phenyl)propionate/3-hydroxycinnamic acid hydroxylase [Paracoccaceae bacterium]|nr:bifunctional 3-(3-hydroxy-phenyl)propionate/3-hydroxycinnamic acid hydroxylase [Paracoccaceae bacterium]
MSDNYAAYNIIIVGLGPVGAIMAKLLANFNLTILILEKTREINSSPRAIHFDGEVMRVFQNAGLAAHIKKVARSTHKGMHFLGENNETLLIRKGVEGVGEQGWENNWYFFQPDLEKVLRESLKRHPNITIRLGENVTNLRNVESKTQVVTETDLNKGKMYYEGDWIIGCDGAKSLVSKSMSSKIEDLGLDEKWLVIDLIVNKDSLKAASLPDYTIQHCNPKRPMTRCYINSSRRRWEIMVLPDDNIEEVTNAKFIWSILKPWLSPRDAVIERAQIYTFHSIIKTEWRSSHMILAGDSAHQSPPFLGQGLCAGIRDASSLAWRLGWVIEGKVNKNIIDSYVQERKSHVREFIDLAVSCGKTIKSGDPKLITNYFKLENIEQKNAFDFPKPQLGSGIWMEGDPPLGQISPQFFDEVHALSDYNALYKLILFERLALKENLFGKSLQIVKNWDIAILRANKAVEKWFDCMNVNATLVRPDRYIYGMANDLEGVVDMLDCFQRAMNGKKD